MKICAEKVIEENGYCYYHKTVISNVAKALVKLFTILMKRWSGTLQQFWLQAYVCSWEITLSHLLSRESYKLQSTSSEKSCALQKLSSAVWYPKKTYKLQKFHKKTHS